MKRYTLFFLILYLILGGCQSQNDTSWADILEARVIRVGMDASYPPFEYVDENGIIVGFDVDFAQEIGRRLELDVQITNIAYDGLYDALLTGQVDLLVSAMVDAPQFEGKAMFTTPYFNAGERLVVIDDSPVLTMQDMDGQTVAVEYGSGGDVEARAWQRRLSNLTVERYPDPGAAINGLLAGEADAALVDGTTARIGVGLHKSLYLAESVVDVPYAAAVHPDALGLHAEVNRVITEMLDDGTVDDLLEKWFGPQREIEQID